MIPKRSRWLSPALLYTGLFVAAASAQVASDPSLDGVRKVFAEKRYKEAATMAATLAQHAKDPQLRLTALLLQAKSLINLADFKSAEPVLDQYIYARPQSSEALYLLGFVLQRENKPKESLAIYNRAASLTLPQANDLKLVALDYVLLHDDADAIIWLKRSLQSDPTNAEAWYFLGRAHMQAGDFIEAEKDFRHVLNLTPDDSKAFDNLGLSLAAQNRNEDSAKAYRDAIASQSAAHTPSEQPYLNLGTLLNDENRASEAVPLLQHAAEIAPDSARCHEELSRALTATNNQQAALLSMQRAVSLDPANPRLHYRLGQLYRKAGQTTKANAEIQISTRLYGSHSTDQP
jgi:Flp pilus assembly protein TadD